MTTTPELSSARARANVRRGKTAEQAVARYLRQWWPQAVRAVRTGSSAAADPGDITGVPGVIISVKDCARADWPRWWAELDAMLVGDAAALGIIVEKRRGHASPDEWWAHLRLGDLVGLAAEDDGGRGASRAPARVALGNLVELLVVAGYAR